MVLKVNLQNQYNISISEIGIFFQLIIVKKCALTPVVTFRTQQIQPKDFHVVMILRRKYFI